MTDEMKPLPSKQLDKHTRVLIDSIKADRATDRVIKSLQRHLDAVSRQYNEPTHYYGFMLPSEEAMLRTDLAYDIAAFEIAIELLREKQDANPQT